MKFLKTLVLLHGFDSTSAFWNNTEQVLQHNFKIIKVDFPKFKNNFTITNYFKFITKPTKNKKHLCLVGQSLGGLIALQYAAKYLPNNCKLVLVSSPIFLNRYSRRKYLLSLFVTTFIKQNVFIEKLVQKYLNAPSAAFIKKSGLYRTCKLYLQVLNFDFKTIATQLNLKNIKVYYIYDKNDALLKDFDYINALNLLNNASPIEISGYHDIPNKNLTEFTNLLIEIFG